ncbi:MAG: dienelactone hydrolase family protein [Alphaproteobacteria bacterium]
MGSMIDYTRPDGAKTRGYLANAGKGKPGVVVIQEWWGLNPQICGVADRFAAAGYNALAPDLYEGKVTTERDEAGHLMGKLDFPRATKQDIRGAAQYLAGTSGKVAVMGFCMGGALTIATAVHVPEFAAGVCFYGIPPASFADPGRIKIPLQCHFANQDDWCTPASVDELEKSMRAGAVPFELYRYDAMHGFFNETSPAYNKACAEQSWQRTMSFLAAKL